MAYPDRPNNFVFGLENIPLVIERVKFDVSRNAAEGLLNFAENRMRTRYYCMHLETINFHMPDDEARKVLEILYEHRTPTPSEA